jgi:beta-glucanase (GH16 family)
LYFGGCIVAEKGLVMFCIHFTENKDHTLQMGFDPSKDFHTYAVDWRPDGVDWYVDNKVVKSYKGETPSKKMFMLIALFQLPWSGELDPNMPYPKTFEVDYVRVYSKMQ